MPFKIIANLLVMALLENLWGTAWAVSCTKNQKCQITVKEDEVKASASFVDDLGADSLDTVELVMALEEEFETEIPDEEAEKITTVQLAIDYINENL